MIYEAGGGYMAGNNQFVPIAQTQQFTQASEMQAGRPPPLQLDSQLVQQEQATPYMMQAPSSMMWPQTPNSFPPTPAALSSQMYAGAPQTTSFVDVAHATWPQSNPYAHTAQSMVTPAMHQHSYQQMWYQQQQQSFQQPQQSYQQPQQTLPQPQQTLQQPQQTFQQPQQTLQQPQQTLQQPQQVLQQQAAPQVQPRPNSIPSQPKPWEEERRRQQALAHETRAKQHAWATEMQRNHLTRSNQVPAAQQQLTPMQAEQPAAPSASSCATPSSPVRPQATASTEFRQSAKSEALSQSGLAKTPMTPTKSGAENAGRDKKQANNSSSDWQKLTASRREADNVQASEKWTPAKSRPTLSSVHSPTAKDSTRRNPRGEAWEPPTLASPSGQSEKSWRRRGKFAGEWASVPVETEEWSQDWEESVEKEKVSQPGPKKVRTRGKFKPEGSSPAGSVVSSPANSTSKGYQTSSWNDSHSRRKDRDRKEYDDSWYQDSWWYEGYEGYEETTYSKGKTASQRRRAGGR